MSLKAVAQETLKILQVGKLTTASGMEIDFSQEQQAAVTGTVLYTPEQLAQLLSSERAPKTTKLPTIEVTNETTQVAAHRLVRNENCQDLCLCS